MACNSCHKDSKIANKHFNLCLECNNIRLHGSKYGKEYNKTLNRKQSIKTLIFSPGDRRSKSLFAPTLKQVNKNTLKEDEQFYEQCFNLSDHKCEECESPLPSIFRDESGKIVARWRYSHIIAKSISAQMRHNVLNINHLCLVCHTQWDHGDKKRMKIYKKNQIRFPQFLQD